ncbi:MAG: hypothetical protein JO121_09495 [Deltaproteobacteria bacterium]|nr:hypothetical protein [Deltaproteobacteria bacterium]
MTKTAVNDLRPCWRCDGITFWRARDGVVHCATCEPARAAWLIAERLRATTLTDTQLRRGMRLILREFNSATTVDAKVAVAAAGRAKISVATLTRARTLLRIRSQKQRSGWMWVRSPH